MKLIVLIATCMLVGSFAQENKLQTRVNTYIDNFIQNSTTVSSGFADSLDLAALLANFEWEIGFVKVQGQAKLYDGKITGLSSLIRKGDAVVIDLDDILIISTSLTFKKINATYKGVVQVNNLGPQFSLDAKIGGSKVTLFIDVPIEGGKADLRSFNIDQLEDIQISISGLGALEWSTGLITTLVLNALETQVAKAVSLKIFESFSKEIGKYPFPAASK